MGDYFMEGFRNRAERRTYGNFTSVPEVPDQEDSEIDVVAVSLPPLAFDAGYGSDDRFSDIPIPEFHIDDFGGDIEISGSDSVPDTDRLRPPFLGYDRHNFNPVNFSNARVGDIDLETHVGEYVFEGASERRGSPTLPEGSSPLLLHRPSFQSLADATEHTQPGSGDSGSISSTVLAKVDKNAEYVGILSSDSQNKVISTVASNEPSSSSQQQIETRVSEHRAQRQLWEGKATLGKDKKSRTPKSRIFSQLWNRLKNLRDSKSDRLIGSGLQRDQFQNQSSKPMLDGHFSDQRTGDQSTELRTGATVALEVHVDARLSDVTPGSGKSRTHDTGMAMVGKVKNVVDESMLGPRENDPIGDENSDFRYGNLRFSFKQEGTDKWRKLRLEPLFPDVRETSSAQLTLQKAAAQKSPVTFTPKGELIGISSDVSPRYGDRPAPPTGLERLEEAIGFSPLTDSEGMRVTFLRSTYGRNVRWANLSQRPTEHILSPDIAQSSPYAEEVPSTPVIRGSIATDGMSNIESLSLSTIPSAASTVQTGEPAQPGLTARTGPAAAGGGALSRLPARPSDFLSRRTHVVRQDTEARLARYGILPPPTLPSSTLGRGRT